MRETPLCEHCGKPRDAQEHVSGPIYPGLLKHRFAPTPSVSPETPTLTLCPSCRTVAGCKLAGYCQRYDTSPDPVAASPVGAERESRAGAGGIDQDSARVPLAGSTSSDRDASRRLTHAELCAGLGVAPFTPHPRWLPYAVRATRLVIDVEDGKRRIVYGGSMRCGGCGFGLDMRPGPGSGTQHEEPEALLRCPRCGYNGATDSLPTADVDPATRSGAESRSSHATAGAGSTYTRRPPTPETP